jgi:hypothetical protein
LRSLQRPLSALLTNLSNNLLRLLSSPEFLNPLASTIQAPDPNPTQAHALSYATLAGELLEVFDELGLGLDSDLRGDGLKSTREGLMSVPLESFTHWSLASRQSLYYSSERSSRLFRRQLRKLPHPRRRSSHNALPPSPTRRQATAAKARSSLISSVSPAGSSCSASGTPQQILTPPDPSNRAGPTASVGSNPLPPMPLPPVARPSSSRTSLGRASIHFRYLVLT